MTQIKVIRERQTDTQTDRHPERQSQLTNYFHYTLQKLVYSQCRLTIFLFCSIDQCLHTWQNGFDHMSLHIQSSLNILFRSLKYKCKKQNKKKQEADIFAVSLSKFKTKQNPLFFSSDLRIHSKNKIELVNKKTHTHTHIHTQNHSDSSEHTVYCT